MKAEIKQPHRDLRVELAHTAVDRQRIPCTTSH